MNSFRLLVVFYVLIIASLALGTDDFNSGTPDTAVERPRPPARPRRPSRQPNRVEPARRAQPRPAPLYNPIPPATPPSLVTDPTHIAPGGDRDPASVPQNAPETGSN